MPRHEGTQSKVHYKGKQEDFIIIVEDPVIAKKYKTDKTIALTEVVNAFQVFTTGMQGAQGELNTASKATLENEFGTSKVEDVIQIILDKGSLQETAHAHRDPLRNASLGSQNNFR